MAVKALIRPRFNSEIHIKRSLLLIVVCLLGSFDAHLLRAEKTAGNAGFEPQKLTVPDGFTAELVAGPPLVQHPTFATFDDQGRLYLSENSGVNMSNTELEEKLPNSIRRLEDTDGDGHFDRFTVFADNMTFPMGGAWLNGALYVASPPHIWRLEDTNDDGIADRRDVLVGKFGFSGNAASIHGCELGPDGRMYWCDGFHGHEFQDETGKIVSKRIGSYLFSCAPDGSDVRIHCGGGMDNPVEVDFTNAGEMLGTVNILYTRPRVDCFVHWLYGGTYPHREKVFEELKVTGDVLGPVHRFGHVAVSGTLRYRSGLLNEKWRDNFFAVFFNSGKVVRLELERSGSTFTATEREFLTCPNRDFHPTDLIEDADGSLLVVDTGGWFYRGCPTSQHAKQDILGGIYRIRREGMQSPDDPRGNQIAWDKLSNQQLVDLLSDPRVFVQQRAIAACAQRGKKIIPYLTKLQTSSDQNARLNAAWTLVRLAPQADLLPLLADQDVTVRMAALHGLSLHPKASAIESLIPFLKQSEPQIRRATAKALGRSGDTRVVRPLLDSLGNVVDRAEEHAFLYALIELNQPEATREGLAADSATVRRGTLIALDQMDDGKLTEAEVVPFVSAQDSQLQLTAAEIFGRHSEWAGRAAEVLTSLLSDPEAAERNSAVIRQIATKFIADPSVEEVIGRALADSQTPETTQNVLLDSIADHRNIACSPSWIQPLKKRLSSTTPSSLERTLKAVAALKSHPFGDRLQQIAKDNHTPVLVRVTAMQVASGNAGSLTEPAFELLKKLLQDGGPRESLDAAQKIGGSSLKQKQLLQLAPYLRNAAPNQLPDLIRPFGRSRDVEVAQAFLAAMKNARSLTSISEPELSDIIKSYPKDLLPAANQLLDQLKAHRQQQLARLDELLPKLKSGNPHRGAEIFFAEKSKCASCHRVGTKGGKIGPDLTTIGANRAGRDLLESIVFPSSTIVRDYEPYNIITDDGRVFSGLIARETQDTIFIQQQTGEPVAIPRNEIETLLPGTVSIMPKGLDQALSEQQLADVVAYLMSLKQPAVTSTHD